MSDFRRLLGTVWASPQIDAEDIAEAAEQGFTLVINNRPDHEESSQPEGASIEAAVRAAGMDYLAIPIDHTGISDEKIAAMAQALAGLADGGKVLAFCRSGTRSTFLWSLAQAYAGISPDDLIAAAAAAGYNTAGMRDTMQLLAEQARG